VFTQFGTIITNGASGSITGGRYGVEITGGGTLDNAGSITATNSDGVRLTKGGIVTNAASGVIKAGASGRSRVGVTVTAGIGSVFNAGTIVGGAQVSGVGVGVWLKAGGAITNVLGGSISGGTGIVMASASDTLTNAGTITGTGGTAVAFGSGDDLLVVDQGAVFNGNVVGGSGTDTVEFASPGTQHIANFSGFEDFQLADGGQNSLTLSAANFAGVTNSTITVTDGNFGNTLDASAAVAADTLIVHAGAGADNVTGGPGNNVFDFNNSPGATLDITNGFAGGSASHGELDFSTSVTNQNLWLVDDNNNLVVEVIGTHERATINGWFGSNPSARLSEIAASDGLKLDSQVAQLATAMATYFAGHTGFDPTAAGAVMPSDPTLQGAIAAAWH
jgi:hypothetical protein